jgi:hypothetical protein
MAQSGRRLGAIQGRSPLNRVRDYISEFPRDRLVRSAICPLAGGTSWMPEGRHGFRFSVCNPAAQDIQIGMDHLSRSEIVLSWFAVVQRPIRRAALTA